MDFNVNVIVDAGPRIAPPVDALAGQMSAQSEKLNGVLDMLHGILEKHPEAQITMLPTPGRPSEDAMDSDAPKEEEAEAPKPRRSRKAASKAEEPAEAPAETEAPAEGAEDAEAPAEDAEAGGSEAAGEVTTVTEGILTMGTNAAFPPYEFYDGDDIVGIDAEIAELLAEKLGLTLEIMDMDFSTIITSVQTGGVDIGLAGMTVTEERLENVNFTDSYATGVQVIIVKEDSDIASVDDLEGKLIGVQEGTTGHTYCSDDYGEENVLAYTNGATAVQNLVQGAVDCVVCRNVFGK